MSFIFENVKNNYFWCQIIETGHKSNSVLLVQELNFKALDSPLSVRGAIFAADIFIYEMK